MSRTRLSSNSVRAATTSGGGVYPQNGAYSATVSHLYTFDAASSFSGSTAVTVTDRAANLSTVPFTVTRDAISPTVAITVPARSGIITVSYTHLTLPTKRIV